MKIIKKITALIGCVIMMCAFATNTFATDNGSWKMHSVFNLIKNRIIDTNDKVYTLTNGYLNVFDKTTETFKSYTSFNELSDSGIKKIYYNFKEQYLIILYSNSNIDILYPNGKIVNIDEYKTNGKVITNNINDITFANDNIYIATNNGYTIKNAKNLKNIESYQLSTAITSVCEVGQMVVLCDATKLYYAPKNKKIKSFSDFAETGVSLTGTLLAINDTTFFLNTNYLYKVYYSNNTFTSTKVSGTKVMDYQVMDNGNYIATEGSSTTATTYYSIYDTTGNRIQRTALKADLKSNCLLSSQESDGSFWNLANNGIEKIELDSKGNILSKSQEYKPESVAPLYTSILSYNPYNDRIYAMNTGTNMYLTSYGKIALISDFNGDSWNTYNMVADTKNTNYLRDPYCPTFDKNNPDTYYLGTWFNGVKKIKNNEVVMTYNWTNSPLAHALKNFYCHVPTMFLDKSNNLWMFQNRLGETTDDPIIIILPSDKLDKDSVSDADFITLKIDGLEASKNATSLCTKDDIKIFCQAWYSSPIIIFNDNGNPAAGNIQSKSFTTLKDQNGNTFSWVRGGTFAEDKNGIVWFGAEGGLVSFDPKEAFSGDFRATLHYDKKNPSQIILDNAWITDISVDDNNNKWVSTKGEGIYCLSADGNEILKHFDTSNSPLIDNSVFAIEWYPKSKSVFIGLNGGLFEYYPDGTNTIDYSKISATPSHVTTDYHGVVTISGLKDKTEVRIKDSNNNIVANLVSTGNIAEWDCLNSNHERVATGVYKVDCVESGESEVHENVATIYVIK